MMGRSPSGEAAPLKTASPRERSRRILVIEPNRKTRSIIQTVLGRHGFQVLAAGNADEGLRQIAIEPVPPEVVVAEAKLEGADGFTLCNRLRADQRTAQVPVILMSRRLGAQQEDLATEVGADDFVAKPAFARDLVSLVQLRAGSSSRDTTYRETTTELPLPALLRALLAGVRSGRIELTDGAGQLTFRHGGVVDAYFGRTRGADALTPMLLLGEGEYSVTFSRTLVKGTFYLSLQELCATVLPAVSRWRHHQDGEPSLSAQLVVDFVALRSALPEIPESAHQIIRLLDGHRTVRECVLDCPLQEAISLAVVSRLFKMGVLVPPDAQTSKTRTAAPRTQTFLDKGDETQRQTPPVREAAASAKYENLHQLLMLEEPVPETKAASPLRAAAQIGAAIVAVVGIAAGAGWVVSRGQAPRFLSHSSSPAKAQVDALEPAPTEDLQEGISLFEAGKATEAVRALTRSAQAHPTTGTWFLLGLAKFESGDNQGAREAVLEALRLNPRHGRARMLLAAIYLNIKEAALAAAELQRYLELEPEGPYAAEARQLLATH